MGVSLETLREVGVLSKVMILEDECKAVWLMFCVNVDAPLEILGVSCNAELHKFLTFWHHF